MEDRPGAPRCIFEVEVAEGGYKHSDHSSKAKKHTVSEARMFYLAPTAAPGAEIHAKAVEYDMKRWMDTIRGAAHLPATMTL
eukprot:SAG22_NODE_1089_length_5599_cov_19.018179_4_plen_82_part_00